MTATAVIVFAKEPLPGLAKTRLAGVLGAQGAARLAERMLRHVAAQAVAAGVGPVELCATPDDGHPRVAALASSLGTALTRQGRGDLGERMARAFDRVLAARAAALLVGSDLPALDAAYLQRAAAELQRSDAVLGPATDGGYVLIGLRRPAPQLFAEMTWSHAGVLAATRERLARAGLRAVELPAMPDIDVAADLGHLPPGWLGDARL